VIKEHFSDCIQIDKETGKLEIEQADWAQKKLALQINDNVYKNLQYRFSVASFDQKSLVHKDALTLEEKSLVVESLLAENDKSGVAVELDRAVDKILISHRNTKILLFMLTGPFLVLFQTIKQIIKYGTLYYFYLQS
jgi:hypothetical protein